VEVLVQVEIKKKLVQLELQAWLQVSQPVVLEEVAKKLAVLVRAQLVQQVQAPAMLVPQALELLHWAHCPSPSQPTSRQTAMALCHQNSCPAMAANWPTVLNSKVNTSTVLPSRPIL